MLPDAEFTLPMDVSSGGILRGTLNGTLNNGASLAIGLIGNSLHIDDVSQYADFVMAGSNNCLMNPDLCFSGVTFSMWLMELPGNTLSFHSIYMSEGCYTWGSGFCIGMNGRFWITIRGNSFVYRYKIPPFVVNQWNHVVFSFEGNHGIALYINGCDAAAYRLREGYSLKSPRHPPNGAVRSYFQLGNKLGTAAHMKLDHFLIWYNAFGVNEVWGFYVQGGIIWGYLINKNIGAMVIKHSGNVTWMSCSLYGTNENQKSSVNMFSLIGTHIMAYTSQDKLPNLYLPGEECNEYLFQIITLSIRRPEP